MNILMYILSGVIAYLLGCLSTGTLIGRIYGKTDLRKTGSGNTGTTNALRTLGWVPGILTLVGDCIKGVLGALIGKWLGGQTGMLIGAVCAVAGHDFPVFTGFKGGKGIATSLGITLVICPPVAPWLVVTAIVLLVATRIMSVGTLAASAAYLPLMLIFRPESVSLPVWLTVTLLLMAMSFTRHHQNIRRLIRGEENKLDFGKITQISRKYSPFRKK